MANSAPYERLRGLKTQGGDVLPMIDNDRFYLIREYAAGIERYELALPKA